MVDTVQTIKFSEMTPGGDLPTDAKTPGLLGGDNVLFNNPWTFLPPGTTGDRPTPAPEMYYRLRFNTSVQLYEYYDPVLGQWTQLQESLFTAGPYIIYKDDPAFPDAFNLGSLTSGILKQTVTAGISTPAIALVDTDYYGPGMIGYMQAPAGVKGLSGNIVVDFDSFPSAVNYLSIGATDSSNYPQLRAKGPAADIGIIFLSKGIGNMILASESDNAVRILSGTGAQHATNFNFAPTPFTRNVTFQDSDGTLAYLSDVAGTVTSAQGTADQVLVNGTSGSPQTGDVILTLPQNINTTSNPLFNNNILGILNVTSAGGTTVLTSTSPNTIYVTGTMNQTIQMPNVATLNLNTPWNIINNSTGIVTVVSSGSNTIAPMSPGAQISIRNILITGTTDASWNYTYSFYQTFNWTPTLTPVTLGDWSVVYNTQQGLQIQINNLVYIEGVIDCVPTFTTASGALKIGNFLNTINANFNPSGIVSNHNDHWTYPAGATYLTLYGINGQNYAVITANGSAVNTNALATTNIVSGLQVVIHFSMVYSI